MGKYLEINNTFGDIWEKLEHAKERIYLLGDNDPVRLKMIDGISELIHDAQQKALWLEDKYYEHFTNEIQAEETEEENSE